jgi:hypothetical protein
MARTACPYRTGQQVEIYIHNFATPGFPEKWFPAGVMVASAVAVAADPELAKLVERERSLPQGRRNAERGTYATVDRLYDRLHASNAAVTVAIVREVLPLLAGLVNGDLTAASNAAFFNPLALCDTCACSPGVSLPVRLTIGGTTVDMWVDPLPAEPTA